jgi:hypothetical protein
MPHTHMTDAHVRADEAYEEETLTTDVSAEDAAQSRMVRRLRIRDLTSRAGTVLSRPPFLEDIEC